MATKIIKEGALRKMFPNQQVSQDAIDFFDDYVLGILTNASNSIKDNTGVKRISKEIASFIVHDNALVVINGDQKEGDEEDE